MCRCGCVEVTLTPVMLSEAKDLLSSLRVCAGSAAFRRNAQPLRTDRHSDALGERVARSLDQEHGAAGEDPDLVADGSPAFSAVSEGELVRAHDDEVYAIGLREPQDLADGLTVENLGARGETLSERSKECLHLLPRGRLELPVEGLECPGIAVVDALDDVQERRLRAGRGSDLRGGADCTKAPRREIDRNENSPEHRPILSRVGGCSRARSPSCSRSSGRRPWLPSRRPPGPICPRARAGSSRRRRRDLRWRSE